MALFRNNRKEAAAPDMRGVESAEHTHEIAQAAMNSILGAVTNEAPVAAPKDDDEPELDAAIRMTQRTGQKAKSVDEILAGFSLDTEINGQSNGAQSTAANEPFMKGPYGEPVMFGEDDADDIDSDTEDNDMMIPSSMAVLSESTEVKGDISVKGDMRICGAVHGNVTSDGSIIIGGGKVDGDVNAKNIRLETGSEVNGNLTAEAEAILSGSVTGNVTAHDLKLCKGSVLKGSTITAQLFSVEGGAIIDSALHIGLVKDSEEPKKTKENRAIQLDHARPAAQPQTTAKPSVPNPASQTAQAKPAVAVAN